MFSGRETSRWDLLALVLLLKAGFGYFVSLTVWLGYFMLFIIPWIADVLCKGQVHSAAGAEQVMDPERESAGFSSITRRLSRLRARPVNSNVIPLRFSFAPRGLKFTMKKGQFIFATVLLLVGACTASCQSIGDSIADHMRANVPDGKGFRCFPQARP